MVSLKEEKQNTLYTGMNFAVYNCCALYYIYKKMKMGGEVENKNQMSVRCITDDIVIDWKKLLI